MRGDLKLTFHPSIGREQAEEVIKALEVYWKACGGDRFEVTLTEEVIDLGAKVAVSAEWPWDERVKLIGLLEANVTALEQQEEEWRKTITYDAPCFQENKFKQDTLKHLVHMATHMPSEFLEANRLNFRDYVE